MSKSDPIVRKETLRIIIGELALSAVMQLAFLLLGFWNITVLFGNILGAFAAVLNFYLMCLTVLKAVSLEPDDAKKHIRTSQMLRMLMLLGFALVGVLLGCFHTIASLIPLFFPRIVITFYQLTHRGETEEQTASEERLPSEGKAVADVQTASDVKTTADEKSAVDGGSQR